MENLVDNQFQIFLTTVYGGIIIGFIYDIYRLFRYYFKPKKIATFIEDMIFWIIVSITTLVFLFYSNWAELRWYIFLGFIIGALLYKSLLSSIILKILIYIIDKLIFVVKRVVYIITYPIRIIIVVLKPIGNKFISKGKKGYKKINRAIKIPNILFKDYKKQLKQLRRKK